MSSHRSHVIGVLALLCAALVAGGCSSDQKAATGKGGSVGSGGSSAAGGSAGAKGSGGAVASGGLTTGGDPRNGGAGAPGGGSAGSAGAGGAVTSGGANGGSGGVSTGGAAPSSDAGPDVNPNQDARTARDLAVDLTAIDSASLAGTNNPVIRGLYADPAIAVFDDTFYIYPTTDGVADWGATSFSAFSSTNLVLWTNRGVILDVAKDLKWATGHAWAPSIARVQDTYYFYFTADNQIGVATAKSPVGPFKDPLGKPLVATGQYGVNAIDPHVFIDDDGQAYLSFGNSGIRLAKLNPDMVSFAGTPADISPAGTAGIVIEGSAIFKRKGTYYLQWSEGDTRQPTYKVAYARAQSPQGPFKRLAVILEQVPGIGVLGPGGSTVLGIASRDEHYIVYHRFKIPGGDGTHRETCIDRLDFGNDGSIVPVKPTLEGLQVAVSP